MDTDEHRFKRVLVNLRYRIARRLVNRIVRDRPELLVPIIHELMDWVRIRLPAKEVARLEAQWVDLKGGL